MFGYKIFISHTNGLKDMKVVRELASRIRAVGATPYIAEDDRQPGKYLSEKIKNNILSSDLVVGIWTIDATNSAYVNQELGFAEGKIPSFLFVQKGVSPVGFAEGKEYFPFDISDPTSGIVDLATYISKQKVNKEDFVTYLVIAGIILVALIWWYYSTRRS